MIRKLASLIGIGCVLTACGTQAGTGAKSARQAGATASTASSRTSATRSRWEEFDFASNVVVAASLDTMPLVELQHIRGIIFGRHGRVFEDSTLQHWLTTRPWYHADTSFTNASLLPREKENLDVVREAEARKHTQIEPGDMRFYQNRVITTAMLGSHPSQDWEVLEAEILANHGFVFENNDAEYRGANGSIQDYFDARYWYQRRPEFHAAELSPIERQNRDTVIVASMLQNHGLLAPGLMNLFQSRPITETMLARVDLASLRLLRNEVYARHGRPFQTPWLADYFRQQPWYSPRSDYSDAELSPIERSNIALITKREDELHQGLATRELSPSDLRGIRPEDARLLRNEIYARHGRRFRDPMLRRYFASFAWYRPNDSFSENQLNETERQNAELIRAFEQGRFTEG